MLLIVLGFSILIAVAIVLISMFQNWVIVLITGAPVGFGIAILVGLASQSLGMYWDATEGHIITIAAVMGTYAIMQYARRDGLVFADVRRTLNANHRRRSVRRSVRNQAKSVDFRFEVES
jgi:hypothetical protein